MKKNIIKLIASLQILGFVISPFSAYAAETAGEEQKQVTTQTATQTVTKTAEEITAEKAAA